ncbi:MAG TPA: MerR family transcriptional regulator [Solirubrobacteraceae bacterium]
MTGRYSAHEAGHLAGVSGDRIGQWARWGHIRASVSAAEPHVYSFDDVAEAVAVHELLARGIALPAIRRVVDRLGGAAAHPLANSGLHVVDGRVAAERDGILVDVLAGARQGVLELDGRVDPLAVLRDGGWPARALGLRAIEVDPERLDGRPVIRGRRIAVQDAAALDDPAAHGLGAEAVAEAAAWLRG